MNASKSAISPTRAENYADWYQEVVRAADLAQMSHVRGCMVIKPWGFGLWEQIQQELDRRIKALGHENVYFPLFIPLRYMQKEAEHAEGFAKEMAVVTHHRLEQRDGQLVPAGELGEPVIVRPTSETIIGESFAEWIQSYRDLPMLLNQWANVVRWELRPRIFLRTTEFLWQEGHTAHATADEAMEETEIAHRMYRDFVREWLAIPVIPGDKPPSERFPGAQRSITIEAMMQDGRALQSGTSHFLGDAFARAAGATFTDRDGETRYVFTTSWGLSTRVIGAVIMTHGDDDGLRVPPRAAPVQVVIIPILRGGERDAEVLDYARAVAEQVRAQAGAGGAALRVRVDDSEHRSVDKKWQWIKRGVPISVEVGPRDLDGGNVVVRLRSDIRDEVTMTREEFAQRAPALLDELHARYYREAEERLEAGIRRDISTRDDLVEYFTREPNPGFVEAPWCGDADCEVAFKDLGVTIRCLPFVDEPAPGPCISCGRPGARTLAVLGRSY